MFTNMPFSWRQVALATLVSTALFVSSCSDDETPAVDGDPTVKVTSSAASDVVWNTVTLTIEATDDKKITKIEVKVDGTVADTQTSSPFDFKWDTQKVTDGSHTIVVTATDDSGKEASWEGALTVQNTLLKFTPASDMLREKEGERGFVFLSDSEGKTIASVEFKNGKTLQITAPSYEGKDFSVTQVIYSNFEGQSNADLQTIPEVKRGVWVLSRYKESPEKSAGQANLTFSGADADYSYDLISNSSYDGTSDNQDASVGLSKNPSMLFIRKQSKGTAEQTYEYALIPSIKVGANPEIDLTKVNKVLTEETVGMPAGGYNRAAIYIYGLRSATDHDEQYYLGTFFNTETESGSTDLIVRYPGSEFSAYLSHSFFQSDDMSAENFYNGVYDNKVLNASIGLKLDGTKFTGTVSGTLDYFIVSLSTGIIYWDIIGNKGKSVIIPEIPATLHDLIPTPDITTSDYIDVTVRDTELVNDYADLLDKIIGLDDGFYQIDFDSEHNYKELGTTLMENDGGRIKGNQDRRTGRRQKTSARKAFRKR